MKVVDMGKSPADLYGIEHLANIIEGNWAIFENRFGDRERTKVCLGEITELRNNLAHRRKEHLIRRENLARFAQNAQMLLNAIGSPTETDFADTVESLLQGRMPWEGRPIEVSLPPHDEIYHDFLGRSNELRALLDWFMSDSKQHMVWGYGGVGKSALAHKFAQEIQETASDDLDAILWFSAKKSEYVESSTRERNPDFSDVPSFCRQVVNALYGSDENAISKDQLLTELRDTKCLLIVDDIDTVMNDQEMAHLLLFELRETRSKILYTSRQQTAGIRFMEVPPFDNEVLRNFITQCAREYGADEGACLYRINAVRSVTEGYPLFVEDLVRYATFVGIDRAISEWSQRRGDAARVYALQRQLEDLGGVSEDTLMAIAVADRPLSIVEIGQVGGLSDEDAESGTNALEARKLITRVPIQSGDDPAYSMNSNTRRLTQSTFRGYPKFGALVEAYKNLTGERKPETRRRAVANKISIANRILHNEGIEPAVSYLQREMTGELRDDSALYGMLGRIYAEDPQQFGTHARDAFQRAHNLGTRNPDTYFHWIEMEQTNAENAVGTELDQDVLKLWREAYRLAQIAIERCGNSDGRCQRAGYLKSREATTLDYLHEFTQAEIARRAAIAWFQNALDTPVRDYPSMPRTRIYRGMALAFERLDDTDGLRDTLRAWHAISSTDPAFVSEAIRLRWRYPLLQYDLAWLATLN